MMLREESSGTRPVAGRWQSRTSVLGLSTPKQIVPPACPYPIPQSYIMDLFYPESQITPAVYFGVFIHGQVYVHFTIEQFLTEVDMQ